MDNTQKVVLGSGKLYCVEYTGTKPEDSAIAVEDNRLGDIQGGASLKYEPTYYTVEDDLGLVKETYLTKENATLTSGILTWNGKVLQKICSTARVTESAGKRLTKIGGISNFSNKSYMLLFVHTNGSKVRIIGSNSGGFEFAFNPDKETVINVEFTAKSMDDDGTLIEFEESIPTTTPTDTSTDAEGKQ